MKKIILFLLLVLVSVTASARKSYITVCSYNCNGAAYTPIDGGVKLTGDVPNNVVGLVYDSQNHYWYNDHNIRVFSSGEILNQLSEYGYEVELVNNASEYHMYFLLSKEIPSGPTTIKGDVNEDSEVNIADVNEVISLILGIVREHPEILEQIKKQTNH